MYIIYIYIYIYTQSDLAALRGLAGDRARVENHNASNTKHVDAIANTTTTTNNNNDNHRTTNNNTDSPEITLGSTRRSPFANMLFVLVCTVARVVVLCIGIVQLLAVLYEAVRKQSSD